MSTSSHPLKSQLIILRDLAVSTEMALHLGQRLAAVTKAHVVNDNLCLLKEAHLNHVLDG